jgi:hypothetical protein
MRVIFLGSAYFGYVYTYAFNPSALDNAAYALAEQEWQALMGADEARPAPKLCGSLRARLAAWLGQRKEEAPC